MAGKGKKLTMRDANLRNCRMYTWDTFGGLGFDLVKPPTAPYVISMVESNSPAAAAGVKIGDVILAVNGKDMVKAKYADFTDAIKKARAKKGPIELRVMEKRFYDEVTKQKVKIVPKEAKLIEAPQTQPPDQVNFPMKERTCDVRLTDASQSFGFDLVDGENSIGVFIQEVNPGTPANAAGLRKSDRIIRIDGELVDDKASKLSYDKIREAKSKLAVKLLVMDTKTYKKYKRDGPPPEPAPTYENVSGDDGRQQSDDDSDSGERTTTTTITARPATGPTASSGIQAVVQRPTTAYPTLASAPREDSDDESTSARASTAPQPPIGLGAVVHASPVAPAVAGSALPANRRRCELRRDRTLGYGFKTDYDGSSEYKHKIIDITPDSPADKKGLRKNDYILTVDDTAVKNMNKNDFSTFVRSQGTAAEAAARPLVLEVFNQDEARRQSSTAGSDIIEPPKTSIPEKYPELRRCTIPSSTKYTDFGFQVDQSSNTYGGAAGFQIKHLKSNSPADRANVRNYDYIIEVNGQNVENDDLEDLRDEIKSIFSRKGRLELLVVDETGYQWYKGRHYPIDPRSPKANVTRHSAPDSPPSSRKNSSFKDSSIPTRPVNQTTTNGMHINGSKRSDSEDRPYTPYEEDYSTKPPGKQVELTTSPDANSGMTSGSDQRNQYTPSSAGQFSSSGTGRPQSKYDTGASSSYLESPSKPQSRPQSRAAIDITSDKRVFRFYALSNERREPWGFTLQTPNNKHWITNIKPGSLAESAGLTEQDCVIEIDRENVEDKPNRYVVDLLRTASKNGHMNLLVAPDRIYEVPNSSSKSLQKVEESYYSNLPSAYDYGQSSANTHRSRRDDIINLPFEPSDPLPRKCRLIRDSSSEKKCGFEVIQKDGYETPIVSKVYADSPAKRSGLSEGDHIVAVQSENVQNSDPADVIDRIRRDFHERGEVELLVLTGPAFQILQRRGGVLRNEEFDYQTHDSKQMHPRLFRLDFQPDEHTYGLSFRRENLLYISHVEPGSSADSHGIKPDDIVLEIDKHDAKYLSVSEAKTIIEDSKQKRVLEILVIDVDGYQYSVKHAIPLNSLLLFVQKQNEPTSDKSRRAIYL